MTATDRDRQRAVFERAIERGINWIDTAATYGGGQSERSVGAVLRGHADATVHVATKVRLIGDDLNDIHAAVRRSVEGSLERLGATQVTLLQLHNAITVRRGEEATSVTPDDVLRRGGVLEALEKLRDEKLVRHIGLTAVGQAKPLREVIASGEFETIQVPLNVVNASAGMNVSPEFKEANYGNVISLAKEKKMGVFAIRVFAAGAILEAEPSDHTLTSKFFSLDLYRRDTRRVARLRERLGETTSMHEVALRFSLHHRGVDAAIVGFGTPAHVDAAIDAARKGPLPEEVLDAIREVAA